MPGVSTALRRHVVRENCTVDATLLCETGVNKSGIARRLGICDGKNVPFHISWHPPQSMRSLAVQSRMLISCRPGRREQAHPDTEYD